MAATAASQPAPKTATASSASSFAASSSSASHSSSSAGPNRRRGRTTHGTLGNRGVLCDVAPGSSKSFSLASSGRETGRHGLAD